ncbi:basic secretory family protein [Cellulomonas sp. ACRRI]|uniref:basic secretory family protein n=1 Tax=Cellulomonas sp. ACRRI TaxID=2918188 RepID=UPI001EF36233|nr:basic secretory family protein [Cellulomonas sp. ACRRI]MCG7285349.1 basic secretory family protein [Cellulomonas sp. ACRRI]
MDKRGAGLAALSVALVALLAACGGKATASEPEPAATPTEQAVDVEAVARDEIAAIDALGYPTELAEFQFEAEYENSVGGTASTSQIDDGTSVVRMSLDPAAYEQFGPDVETSVRSTVRHELGHVWTFWLFPSGAEAPLSKICLSVSERSLATGYPANECAAEAVSEILTEQRGGERVVFYGLALSERSIDGMRPIVDGAPSWTTPGA